MKLIIPKNYDPVLTVRETQEAIKYIRDTFQYEFGKELNLSRISKTLICYTKFWFKRQLKWYRKTRIFYHERTSW